ncbi:AMP-binding protein [Loigolactobacillus backii]|uniref:Uncharacterized protein n=1 Tax=Loigolactobacillus backii TaxID=375175 RepID=A0A192H2C8_9LACO|nr:AMP-binding protein [Loigolactobacillus backii]ANK62096.1 hypothetical protein AYR53_04520 [Loigolactobacillus backii]ANK68710.1 hypothetical protein AYR56_00205 [Loigolactobacillus backii]MDA5386714.1 AMP-binding protein [Loigolactobacillus backii]MDA5389239.1 AMP-binding protein [Loigolactobacillus backii]
MSQLTEQINQTLKNHYNQKLIKEVVTNEWFTGRQIAADRDQLVARLREQGIVAGDLVLVSLPNSVGYVTVLLALLDLGAISYTIDPAMPRQELTTVLAKEHYAAAFFSPQHVAMLAELQSEGLEFQENSYSLLTAPALTGYLVKQQDFVHGEKLKQYRQKQTQTLGVLLYTSGTTGAPKAVVLNHEQLLAAAEDVAKSQELTMADRTLLVLPLFHINAQVISLLATLISGGTIVMVRKFSASHFWPLLAQEGITWVSAAPAVIAILLKRQQTPILALPHLRFIRSASAPLAADLQSEFQTAFQVPVIQGYGMTEAASQITVNPLRHTKLGSVGKATETQVRITDSNGTAVAPLGVGEVLLKGKHVIHHYVDRQHDTDFENGWFKTGDLGYLDQDGYLFLVGRKKEMINRSGDKINPNEVESVLLQLPQIDQAAVIGLPDAIYGEKVVAAVVLSQPVGIEPAELAQRIIAYTKEQLSRFKCPSEIIFLAQLPLGPTGKVKRRQLKQSLLKV